MTAARKGKRQTRAHSAARARKERRLQAFARQEAQEAAAAESEAQRRADEWRAGFAAHQAKLRARTQAHKWAVTEDERVHAQLSAVACVFMVAAAGGGPRTKAPRVLRCRGGGPGSGPILRPREEPTVQAEAHAPGSDRVLRSRAPQPTQVEVSSDEDSDVEGSDGEELTVQQDGKGQRSGAALTLAAPSTDRAGLLPAMAERQSSLMAKGKYRQVGGG